MSPFVLYLQKSGGLSQLAPNARPATVDSAMKLLRRQVNTKRHLFSIVAGAIIVCSATVWVLLYCFEVI